MLQSYLCDYFDAYILAAETITVPNITVAYAAANNGNKNAICNS